MQDLIKNLSPKNLNLQNFIVDQGDILLSLDFDDVLLDFDFKHRLLPVCIRHCLKRKQFSNVENENRWRLMKTMDSSRKFKERKNKFSVALFLWLGMGDNAEKKHS